jgi:sugar transferase (PEP-CTERM/EpsH1 system associated)
VHGEHGWEAQDPRGLDPKGLRIRRACRPVIHCYVPMSRDLAQWLEREVRVDPRRIRQLYSGVDVDKFRPAATTPPPETAAGQGSTASRSLTIGTVGRLDPVKNQAALLSALAALRPNFPGLRITVVGGGPLRSELEMLADRLGVAGQVTFTGARSDTPDLMRAFDVFVLPSLNEGVSNTILEAMASGLPVVATKVGGNPELVADGVTGRLYDPDVPGALEAALTSYVADSRLRDVHGRAARDRVVQNFSLDAMVSRYAALYDELLADR